MTAAEALDAYAKKVNAAATPHDVFAAAEAIAQDLIGHSLFTIMRFDASQMAVQRIYSSNSDAYPVGGRKPKRNTKWGHHVLEQGKVFIGTNDDNIRCAFDDSELIIRLDLHAVLNIPIRSSAGIIGTMNLLDRAARYGEEAAELGKRIAHHLVDAVNTSAFDDD